EPDFDTPSPIRNAGIRAIQEGNTRYTPPQGLPELRQAIADKLYKENNLSCTAENIIVCSGGKQAIFNMLMCICNPGDEVIIPKPYWVSYPEMVRLASAKPVFLPTCGENGFSINVEQLKKITTNKTKALIICSPNNPTGAILGKNDLEAIAKWAVINDIFIISDEIYEKIIYKPFKHYSIGSLNREILKNTITVNGLSKGCAMTGWRLGYAAAHPEIIKQAVKLQAQTTHAPSTISQKAAVFAFKSEKQWHLNMVKSYTARRDIGTEILRSIPGVSCFKPQGAFYLFPEFFNYYNKEYKGSFINNSSDLCSVILEEVNVACVPGSAFGDDRFIRISYACGMRDLKGGLKKIVRLMNNIRDHSIGSDRLKDR
ncbi:MAG: pyridoxal phosphate-dependent aminotransferase, partial [bacterium]